MSADRKFLRTLIVDDNAAWAQQVTRLIEANLPASSREVRWEGTISAGKKAVIEDAPDIVLLDLTFPDSDAEETIEQIPFFNTLRVVFILTALAAENSSAVAWLKANCAARGAAMMYAKDEMSVLFMLEQIKWVHSQRVLVPQLKFAETAGLQAGLLTNVAS
jgi:DNA-binding NarL/FixJ family response regulator